MAKKAKRAVRARGATRPKAQRKPLGAKPRVPPKPASPKTVSVPRRAPPTPTTRVPREEFEEETVCTLEFLGVDGRSFIARIDTSKGGMREHRAPSFMDLLELVAEDLREEFSEA